MRIRKTDRLVAAIIALLLLAALISVGAQLLFGYSVQAHLHELLRPYPTVRILAAVLNMLLMIGLIAWSIGFIFRRRREKGFVSQKAEDGSIDISFPALRRMVEECLAQHEELRCESLSVQQDGSGIAVELTIALVRGVSVPLTVADVQKQIRRYVTACSGLEVREVSVKVDHELTDAQGSFRYAITDMLHPALPEAAKPEPEAPETAAVPEHKVSVFDRAEVELNMPPKPEDAAPVPAPDEPKAEEKAQPEEEEDDFEPFDGWSIPAPTMSFLPEQPHRADAASAEEPAAEAGEAPGDEPKPEAEAVLEEATAQIPEAASEETPEEASGEASDAKTTADPETKTAVENNK